MKLNISYKKGFVLNPDKYYCPSYRITPFQTSNLVSYHELQKTDFTSSKNILDNKFYNRKWIFTSNGKEAINIALKKIKVKKNDLVTILTSSGNKYISKCVTDEISKFCNWSRKLEKKTSTIFINHEFGYPFKSIEKIKKLNIPIIEDLCHSFFTSNEINKIGSFSDFSIYSLPKIFPIQIGGILSANNNNNIYNSDSRINFQLATHIKNILSINVPKISLFSEKRLINYKYLKNKLRKFGCIPRFKLDKNLRVVPSVYLFKCSPKINLNKLKEFYTSHGVECSVFYGENCFFLPIHQNLTKIELDYFVTIFEEFLNLK
jgi:hypothetical protein